MQLPNDPGVERLEPFVGEWSVEAVFPGAPRSDLRGRTVFEWAAGRTLLVQRWDVPHPDAPDGAAIIRFDAAADSYQQHYFDSRGVARVYDMGFADGVWTLSRTKPDLSPLDFAQRFTGTFGDEGDTISGRWEIAHAEGRWEHDFELIYRRLPSDRAA